MGAAFFQAGRSLLGQRETGVLDTGEQSDLNAKLGVWIHGEEQDFSHFLPHFPDKKGRPKDQMAGEGGRLCPELTKVASLTTVRWQEAPRC